MKERAPRNRTLIVHEDEKDSLMRNTISLSAPVSAEKLQDKLIYHDLFSCIDFLPEGFIDLLVVDPPYNLNKKFGTNQFTKTSSASYEDWLDSWITRIT